MFNTKPIILILTLLFPLLSQGALRRKAYVLQDPIEIMKEKLRNAVYNNQTEYVAKLLKRGADVTMRVRHDQKTLIHAACHRDNPQMIALLIEHGADPNAQDKYGDTPLSDALRCGNYAAARYLFSRPEVLTTILNNSGQTAIQHILNLDLEKKALLGITTAPNPHFYNIVKFIAKEADK